MSAEYDCISACLHQSVVLPARTSTSLCLFNLGNALLLEPTLPTPAPGGGGGSLSARCDERGAGPVPPGHSPFKKGKEGGGRGCT